MGTRDSDMTPTGSVTANEESPDIQISLKEANEGVPEATGVLNMSEEEWMRDPHNPWNWPASKKVLHISSLSAAALLA
jgi:hypothetical protein